MEKFRGYIMVKLPQAAVRSSVGNYVAFFFGCRLRF